jgi:hypothetical protein
LSSYPFARRAAALVDAIVVVSRRPSRCRHRRRHRRRHAIVVFVVVRKEQTKPITSCVVVVGFAQ